MNVISEQTEKCKYYDEYHKKCEILSELVCENKNCTFFKENKKYESEEENEK